jgi:hypothetical protein
MARQQTKVRSQIQSASAGKSATHPVAPESDSSSIAVLAYQLWHARGCPEGSPEIDWFQAEMQLCDQSAKIESPSTKQLLLKRSVVA